MIREASRDREGVIGSSPLEIRLRSDDPVMESGKDMSSMEEHSSGGRVPPRRTVAELFRALDHDEALTARFRMDPRQVLREHGFDIPDHVDPKVVESKIGRLHLTLEVRQEPARPRTDEEIEIDRLTQWILRSMERKATELYGRPCPASRAPSDAHIHVVYRALNG